MTASQLFRFAAGGRIDRTRLLSFSFNGRNFSGYDGDTLASALLANGVRVVGRSFKYHRPRGLLGAGAEECNALVTVGSDGFEEPNVRATLQPLYADLRARSQNCWPGVDFDLGRCVDYFHFLWPAGFYNKTFKWPDWHWYEPLIRRMSGLGRLPPAEDPDEYAHRNIHCDVLIVGTGPAGLGAAMAASDSGLRVIILEQDMVPGGSLLWDGSKIDGRAPEAWLHETLRSLRDRDNVTLLTRTTASAWFDHNLVVASERVSEAHRQETSGARERLWKIHAGETIMATGAIEQPLVFPNNDRPGIMLGSAVQQYCTRFAVAAGRRVVIATNNNSAYSLAAQIHASGVEVAAIVDSRPRVRLIEQNTACKDIAVYENSVPIDSRGDKLVQEIRMSRRAGSDRNRHAAITLECDCIAMAGGWQPAVQLFSQARGRLKYDTGLGGFVPEQLPPNVQVAGMLAGAMTPDTALEQGWDAGVRAATGRAVEGRSPGKRHASAVLDIDRVWMARKASRQWIDFQHDVTLQDIDIAVAENYRSVEHLKRYTTAGMSVDQGKTSNLNALVALAERTGCSPAEVGTTTFRPFCMPVTLGALAGRNTRDFYSPVQRGPLAACHENLGAVFDDYGTWRRPRMYPRAGEDAQATIARESVAARMQVVLFDGSPLGKIDVHGPDAAEFLDRVYVNKAASLAIGKARYGLMLNENGVVIDDGILARLAEQQFLVHTTSGRAARIHSWMQALLQGDWPDLDVLLTFVTSQWANISVSGPRARELVARLDTGIDLAPDRFPHMSVREGTQNGVPLRVLRASFTGELGYELNVPADWGSALWDHLLERGSDLGVMPIGLEALNVLRVEKGYLHVGTDTDGYTTPPDIGWGALVARRTGEFIGKRSLRRPYNRRQSRLELVGLRPEPEDGALCAGAHVVDVAGADGEMASRGYVTSACFSANLQRYVALGLVQDGSRRVGERVRTYHDGKLGGAIICGPAAWDPDGARVHV